ncbi:MAG: MurR/RpiR family transcriptional regulator [Candidatus Methylomirabilales bacterium]
MSSRRSTHASYHPHVPGCFIRIRNGFSSLSRGERLVAEAILRDPHAVTLESVTDLARRSNTSPAAVSRFCRKLGFDNFPRFKIRLSHDLASPMADIHEDITVGDKVGRITRKVVHGNIQTLTDTLQGLEEKAVADAVDLLSAAPRITFFGSGGSGIVAQDAAHKFMRTGKPIAVYTDKHLQLIQASLLGDRDVVVAVSHTGRNRDLLDVLRVAKSAGARIVAITHYGASPTAKLADVVLYTIARETAYRRESLSSRIAALTIVDVLYVGVGVRLHQQVIRNIKQIRQAILRTRL